MNYFHENLKYYRKIRNITQEELASEVYITRQCISNYEKGARLCELDTLVRISDALNITLDTLIKYPHP